MLNFFRRVSAVISNRASIYWTLYYNFKWLPKTLAFQLPMIIGKGCKIEGSGTIRINAIKEYKRGTHHIYIGCRALNWMDEKETTMIIINGEMQLTENVFIGSGCRFEVAENANLILKEGTNFTGKATVICRNSIIFGKKNLVSWDTLFMDSDAHTIIDLDGGINQNGKIYLGEHVWIGAKSTILKNTKLSNDIVVAANSVVSGLYDNQHSVIGGNVAKVLKNNIEWSIDSPGCSTSKKITVNENV